MGIGRHSVQPRGEGVGAVRAALARCRQQPANQRRLPASCVTSSSVPPARYPTAPSARDGVARSALKGWSQTGMNSAM